MEIRNFILFWADRTAKEIIASNKHKPYWVDDMKTPSGRIHVGALRGVIIHALIDRALKDQGVKSNFSFVINDMDPMDGFPHYLPESFKKHMGKPLFQIPSPEKGYKTMARCYAEPFIKVFNQLGANPQIIWSSEWYKKGKFNILIKKALDKVNLIRKLYRQISGYRKPREWYPFQVICPKCGKVGTTIVNSWDGEKVGFECRKHLVDWAEGCGFKGKISPFDGNGKLMWKVDWAAHWKVIGVTIEWAGKDHMTEGGSYDLSSAICEQVFNYPAPQAKLYEWFLAKGGGKMSSSKGIGVSALEVSQTLPPEILRFLLIRISYRKAIIFDPYDNQSILDLFDQYDLFCQKYYEKEKSDFSRIWELSQIKPISKIKPFLPRFRDVANYLQMPQVDIYKKFAEIKGEKLTKDEKRILTDRIKYAKIWLKNYAPQELVYHLSENVPVEAKNLSLGQKRYLRALVKIIKEKEWLPENLQQQLYETAKKLDIPVKKAFQAIYLSLIGKTHGPKAAWFLLEQDKDTVIKRFKQLL